MSERNLSADTAQTLSTRATGALQHVDIDAARTTLRQAQTALAALGYDVGDHGDPAERIDGIWSEHTQQAVLAFQTDQGLTRTGQLDPTTTSALLIAQSDAMDIGSTALGDEGDGRAAAEQMLRASDHESVHDVLDGIEPTDGEEELLQ